VRARAKQLGVALSGIAPTGPGGSLTLGDVEVDEQSNQRSCVAMPGACSCLAGRRADRPPFLGFIF
jgi:tartrate dehydratase alpha subunit/fumarate hydratase class I-like protein